MILNSCLGKRKCWLYNRKRSVVIVKCGISLTLIRWMFHQRIQAVTNGLNEVFQLMVVVMTMLMTFPSAIPCFLYLMESVVKFGKKRSDLLVCTCLHFITQSF